jgi:AraC-like DNA-binding protein
MHIPLHKYPWHCFLCETPDYPMTDYHRHNEVELSLLEEGALSYDMDGVIRALPPKRLCLIWGGISHKWAHWEGPMTLRVICLPMHVVMNMGLPSLFLSELLRGGLPQVRTDNSFGLDCLLMKKWMEDLQKEDPARQSLVEQEIEGRLRRMVFEEDQMPSRNSHVPGGDALARILAVINEQAVSGSSIEEMAKMAHLHPKYAMRLFKQKCGMSILHYVHHLRISYALRLLRSTDMRVTDIALACGFGSSAQFYDVYGKIVGGKPRDFRKEFSGGLARNAGKQLAGN